MGNFSKWRKLEEAKGRDDAYYRNDTRSQAEIQGYDLGYDHPDNVSREDLLRYIGEARRRNNTYMGAESGSGLDWHYSHQFDEHSKDDDDSLDFTSPVKRSNTAKKATDGNNARPSNLFQAALGAFSTFSPVAGNKSGFTPENNTHYAQMDPALAEEALMGFYSTHPQDYTTNMPYTAVGKDRLTELAQQLRVSQQENEGSIARQRQKALEEEAARRQAWFDERADKYANIPLKDDFEQNISGWEDVGKANDPLMTEAARGYELTVPLENRDADTQNALKQQEADSAYNVSRMSPTERKVYRYLQNTEGNEAAQDYMDYLSYRLNARNMNEVRAAAERGTETTGGKIVHSALSVPANLAGGALGAADYAIQNVRSKFSYRPIDYNSGSQIPGEYASAVRENTQENMGNVGRFVYGTAMSMADSAASMLTIGKGGGALLGLSAGRQGVKDAIDAGATDSQAIAMGLFNGAAEMIFENIGIDNLYSILESGGTRTFKSAVKSILGQALSEGTEEVGTTLANTWGDAVIMADKSEINRMIDEYMSDGASREQATRAAWLNWAQNLGMDFLGGLTSGALFGIGGTIINNVRNDVAIGQTFQSQGAPNGMNVEEAVDEVTGVPNLYSKQTVNAAQNIRESGIENVSDRTLGRFYRLFVQDQQNLQRSGINDFDIAEYVERGMEPYQEPRTNVESSIARDESGNVDVEQTLRNAAQETTAMEFARENEQNDADTRRAWEYALSMPQQNTAIDAAAQRMVDEYTNRAQENAAASNQNMPVTAQENAQERSVVSPEESIAQTQKPSQAAENGVQATYVNGGRIAGTETSGSGTVKNNVRLANGETAQVQNISVSDNGVVLETSKGSVLADDVQIDDPSLYTIVSAAEKYDTQGAQALFRGYEKSDLSAQNYVRAFESAYESGHVGLDYGTFLENGGYATFLDKDTRMAAYAAGQRAAQKDNISEQATTPAEESPSTKKPDSELEEKPQAETKEKPSAKSAEESTTKPEQRDSNASENTNALREEESNIASEKDALWNRQSNDPSQKLASVLIPLIDKGTAFNSAFLFEQADKAFGGTQAQGVYTPKDAYDAMELAVNEYLLDFARDFNGDAKTAVRAINKLQNLVDKLPTQTKRTAEMESFQQFSTPPTLAYLAAWVADISNTDTVLEPSAGIGGLAVYPKAWGAQTVVNELSQRRLAVLENMGFDLVFNENAEQINNVLPADVHPSVVLMNPPFSSTAGRTSTNKTSNAARHIEQALLRLNDGGRLVAILGRGMADNAASFQKWWGDIKGKYNVRANISIDGKNYRKYGTSFDVQLVVIDKTGPQSGETLTGTFTDLKEIPQALRGIRDDRSEGIVRESGTGTEHGASVRTPVDRGAGATDMGRSGGSVGDVTVRDGGRTDVSTGGTQGRDVDVAGTSGNVSEGVRQTDRDGRGSGRRGDGGVPAKHGDGDIRSGDIRSESKSALSGLNESESLRDLKPEKQTPSKVNKRGSVKDNGVYAQYVPAPLPISGAKPHPARLVESAAMSAVSMPKATYVPDLPTSLITSGAISDAQLENIVYAGQANEQILPDGERRGYFIGDGTGVGKGRQIAAIIMDNIRQGRKKAVWISKNTSLFADAQRDWADIGGDKSYFINGKNGDFPKNPKQWERADGILFLTYGGLSNSPRNKETTNLDTVVSWLGKDFDGLIAFDEAHEMGNAISLKGKRGTKQPSQKALAGIELQKRLPNARIVYVSATGATEVSNLAYATRLGLWGKGTAFANVQEFVDKIGSSGLAAMELVSRDMKASGSYLARSISYDDVKYETLEHKLTRSQRTIYDTMSEAWQVVLQNVNEALSLTGQQNNGKSRGSALSTFYSYLQSFYNQVLTSMAMPSVVEDIQKQLDDGKSVVLQIVNTNEAQQERAKKKAQEEGMSLEDLDMTPRDMLLQYLEKSFPTQVYEEYEDDNGNIKSRPVFDSKGNPVKDHQAEAMRDALIERVKQMSVPDGALDILLNAFGTENVAEVTGRSSRVVYKKDASGNSVRVEERRSSSARDADTTAFQNGDKRILVFSQAGGTGKSYHADLRAKNQQQRVHYLIQPGWEAAKATQGFGRTHRSNQASAPIFKLVTTDVKGHKRFISTIARRLDQLGALTKGQRNTGSGIFGEKDNLESPIAIRALQTFYDMLGTNKFAGLDGKEVLQNLGLLSSFTDESGNYKTNTEVSSNMSRFLNRILALKVDEQNKVFDAFMSVYDEAYDWAIANDALDTGMETVKADSIDIIDDTVVRKDENTGAETRYVQANVKNKPRLISYKQLKDLKNDFVGLYRINDTGEVRAVYRIADKTNPRTGEVQRQYSMQTAVFGKSNTIMESRFNDRLTEIPKPEWQAAWREAISAAPEYNEQTYHMLTGSLLPIWGLLPQDDRVRVKRLTADDGRTYLGRIIDPSKIDSVLNSLGTTKRTKQTYSASDVFRRVMNGDDARLLYNGWHLKRSRVSGEQRIEITGKNLFEATDYPGVFSERIAYIYRYFIPTDEKTGVQVIEQITKNNPVVDVSRGSSDDVEYMIRPQTPPTQQAPTQRVGAQQGNTLSLSEIVERLRHDFDVNVTIGHVRGSGVLGTYSNTTNGIRSRLYNDLPTISHELGHHLDNRYGITDSVPSAVLAELIRCAGSQKRGNTMQTMKEGLAEFIRLYLQNSETATIDYPNIESLIRTRVDANDMALLDALANEVNAYYVQSEKTAASSIVSAEAGNADSRTLGEKIMDKGHQAYQDFVDSLHGIKLFSDRYGGNAYTLAMNSAYSDAVAANAIRGDQLRDLNGNIVGDGLRKALRGVKLSNKAEYAAFNEYLVVRHGPERLREHMRVFANDRQNSTTWMNQRQSELESQYPEFRAAADRLYKYQRNVLFAYGVQTGLISQEAYDEWGARWSFYVPFNRQMDENSYNGRGVKRGFANQNSTIKRARGSGRNIVNPLENVFSNTAKLITASMRNTVMQEIVRMVESNPDDMTANWLERVPDPIRVQRDNVSPVKSQIAQEAQNAFVLNDDLDALSDILQNVDDILIEYRRAATSRDNRVVTVLNGGQQSFWKINDELLFDSLVNMEPQRIPSVLRLLTNTNHLITSNLTGNNVVWSIFSNAPRDLMTALTYSKDKNLIHMVANIGKSYVNSFRGIKHVDKQSPMYQEFLSMGGGADSIYSSNRNIGKDARRMITGKREGVWDWVKSPLDLIEWISNTIEAGPRYAEYVARRNAGASPAEAIYAAHDVTVNFRRSGAKSRIINQVVPFFNANVQGVDKLARQMAASDVAPADRKKVSGIRMGVWLGVCIALGALMVAINHGNEEKERDYATLSTYTKNNYFCIPLGDGKFLTIPKPREIAVPSSFSSAVLEYAWNSNENAFDDFGEYAIDMVAPPIADNLATAVWKLFTESPEAAGEEASNALGDLGLLGVTHYLSANKDFLGRPIVSSSLENVEAKDQYTARTSKIAYAIGQAFNMSPVKIDYFFQNTLGGWWKNQQALFPMDNSNVDYTIGVASTWVRDNLYSTDIVNTMYDNATAAKRAANSDPDNGGKAAWNQQCNQMATFYSRFYGLTKGNSGEQTRISRRTVLDMISDFNDSYGNGNETPEQKAVYDIVRSTGNTAILPVAMQTTIKYDSLSGKQEIKLSPDAYVEYQTEYNALYWERAVILATRYANYPETAAEKIEAMKKEVREQATESALRRARKKN